MSSNGLTAWSYSRLAKYETCPAAFKYRNIDRLPEPQSPAMLRGDLIHQDMAALLKDPKQTGAPVFSLTLAAGLEPPRAIDAFAVCATEVKNARPMVEQQWGFTRQWTATGWFGKDTWYRSILDVGVVNGSIMLVSDWKTGRPYGDNKDQMEQFALATFSRYRDINEVDTRLWYLDTGDEQALTFYRRDASDLRTKWEKRVEPLFNDVTFAPRPSSACRFCHFRRSNDGPCKFG